MCQCGLPLPRGQEKPRSTGRPEDPREEEELPLRGQRRCRPRLPGGKRAEVLGQLALEKSQRIRATHVQNGRRTEPVCEGLFGRFVVLRDAPLDIENHRKLHSGCSVFGCPVLD